MTFLTRSCCGVLGSRFHCKAPEATLWLACPSRRPHAARWSLPLAGPGPASHPVFASLCLRSLPRLFLGWSLALPTTWHKAEIGKDRVEGRGQAWWGEELAAKVPSLVSLGLCHQYHCHRSSFINGCLCQVSGGRAVTFIQLLLSARACAVSFPEP